MIQQIESKRKAKYKLPSWYQSEKIYYPSKLNLEQTSSEITANYKTSIIKGKRIADITGGFGVDSFYFSNVFEEVYHFELNKNLSEIASYNFSVLNKKNVYCFNENGTNKALNESFDFVYADPSRRHESKGKVFYLKDCEPNIPLHLTNILKLSKKLLIKTSPMLDISIGLKELQFVSEIHIVAINNEVKELLWLIKSDFNGLPKIITININKDYKDVFEFNIDDQLNSDYSTPKIFLYEPNAAIMKSGGFNLISNRYKIQKLHKHTHLFTNDTLINFPGRKFIINEVISYQKKNFKKIASIDRANISIRNFPESVAVLRKKLKIKDGGALYLFFTTNKDNKKIIISCTKV